MPQREARAATTAGDGRWPIMRRVVRRTLRICPGLALAACLPQVAVAQTGDVRRVHDPAIIKHGDSYYIFSTGAGIPIRRSSDLVHWELAGRVFEAALPDWAEAEVPGTRFPWAPDISYFNGKYHLYYSISTFGENRSVIGLATNTTLDPGNAEYRWEDRGKVIESSPGVTDWNAIDPAVVLDQAGNPWMSWGSFWGGIKMRKLDPATGKVSREDTTLYTLAVRQVAERVDTPLDDAAIEAPFIIRLGDYYYLFVSFDLCCRGERSTYNIRVGRSEEVTGPYLDRDGVPMTRGGGTRVLASSGRVHGPGHNAVLTESERQYLVHHFYDAADEYTPKLQIRPLTWSEDGWPIAGAPLAQPE